MPFRLIHDGRSPTIARGQEAEAARRLWDEFQLRLELNRMRLAFQDAWLLMYLMLDPTQDGGPTNREKYYSNRPQSIVDTAVSVLAKNPVKYHILSQHFRSASREEREPFRVLENVLQGVMYDIQRQLRARGEEKAAKQASFHSLVRGAWAYKLHLTNRAATSTGSPIFYQQYDPRLCLPEFDHRGVYDVIAFNVTTLGRQYEQYQDELSEVVRIARQRARRNPGGQEDNSWWHTPLTILEYSSRDEHGVLLDLSGLPDEIARAIGINPFDRNQSQRWAWLERPYRHGFDRSLIQYGNVNGMPAGFIDRGTADMFLRTPALNMLLPDGTRLHDRSLALPNGQPWTGFRNQLSVDPADGLQGRSMFHAVGHLFPEYNKMIALMKQHGVNEVRGTYTLQTRDGRMKPVEVGQGSVNPIALNERLERMPPSVRPLDLMQAAQLISQEIADGSLDLRFILASESEGSGFLRARMEQAALVAVDPYKDGLQAFHESVAESFMVQYRKASSALGQFQLHGRQPGESTRFFVVDVDDHVHDIVTEGREPPTVEAVVKVSMPVDMMARINMAKAAIDPGNPIMSLAMALDVIMEFDDSEAAYDMIFEDQANRNPTIQLLHLAESLKRNGAPQVAELLLRSEFRAAFEQQMQQLQARTHTPAGASPGVQPGTMPPEQTTGGGTEATIRSLAQGQQQGA